jgi:hypothetical protein
MNWKKCLLTFAAVFVAATLLGFVIHVLILGEDYRSLGHLHRDQPLLPFLLLANLAFALGFAWLYAKGVEEKPWLGQGLRFGFAVWLLWAVPFFLIQYSGQPLPGSLVLKQIGIEFFDMLILGLIAAAVYRR